MAVTLSGWWFFTWRKLTTIRLRYSVAVADVMFPAYTYIRLKAIFSGNYESKKKKITFCGFSSVKIKKIFNKTIKKWIKWRRKNNVKLFPATFTSWVLKFNVDFSILLLMLRCRAVDTVNLWRRISSCSYQTINSFSPLSSSAVLVGCVRVFQKAKNRLLKLYLLIKKRKNEP